MRRLRLPGFSLLSRELAEQAAQKRTFAVRFLFGLLLLVVFAMTYPADVEHGWSPGGQLFPKRAWTGPGTVSEGLGSGGKVFRSLVEWQLVGIALFLPVLVCSAIAGEKEKGTLGLLLLTGLSPWSILLQKLAARLLPMLTVLVLSLPLFALAYGLGGVTPVELAVGVWCLVLAILQVGALALLLSAREPTSRRALVATYVAMALLYPALSALEPWLAREWLGAKMWGWRPSFLPPEVFDQGMGRTALLQRLWLPASPPDMSDALLAGIPALASILLFLLLARFYLLRRAFVASRGALVGLFRLLDRFYQRANALVGGVVLARERSRLPGDRPVAWLESTRGLLGKGHWRFRVITVVELPLVFIGALALPVSSPADVQRFSALVYLLWGAAAALLASRAAGAFSAERARGTLDPLLVTPLPGDEIVRQKWRGLAPFLGVLALGIATAVGIEALAESGKHQPAEQGLRGWTYLALSLALVAIYLPLVGWIGLAVGLRVRSGTRAALIAVGLVAAWAVLPQVAASWLIPTPRAWAASETWDIQRSLPLILAYLVSPLFSLAVAENGVLELRAVLSGETLWTLVSWNLILALVVLYAVRRLALTRADRWLGRPA